MYHLYSAEIYRIMLTIVVLTLLGMTCLLPAAVEANKQVSNNISRYNVQFNISKPIYVLYNCASKSPSVVSVHKIYPCYSTVSYICILTCDSFKLPYNKILNIHI